MRLKKDIRYLDFLEQVKACRADVYFQSEEGDKLNLKSAFSQFLFSTVCGDRELMENGDIVCEDEADYSCLQGFLV